MVKLSEKKKKDLLRDKVLKHANKKEPSFPILIKGLESYDDEWNFQMAAHLLRRTTIGPTIEEINQSVSDGLDVTISKLLDQSPVSFDPPINYLDDEDNDCKEPCHRSQPLKLSQEGQNRFGQHCLGQTTFVQMEEHLG